MLYFDHGFSYIAQFYDAFVEGQGCMLMSLYLGRWSRPTVELHNSSTKFFSYCWIGNSHQITLKANIKIHKNDCLCLVYCLPSWVTACTAICSYVDSSLVLSFRNGVAHKRSSSTIGSTYAGSSSILSPHSLSICIKLTTCATRFIANPTLKTDTNSFKTNPHLYCRINLFKTLRCLSRSFSC